MTLHCTGVIPGILGLGTLHSFARAQGRVQDLLLPTLRNFHFAPTLARWPSAQYCSEPEQKGGSQWALGSCAVPAQREARLSGDFTRSTKPGRPFLSPKRAKTREPRTALNKLKNKSDPWRGQKAACPLQEPLPTKRQVGRAEAAQNPKVRAHAVSAQSTQSLWLFRATQRQQLPPCSPRLRVQSSFEGMTELRA